MTDRSTDPESPARIWPALSGRENQIMDLATRGLTDKEIASELGVRFTSVKSHWVRIRRKLAAANRAQAIARLLGHRSSADVPGTDARRDLRCLRAYWATLLENVPLFVAVVDPEGRVQWCGDRRWAGLASDLVGRRFADLVAVEQREDFVSRLSVALSGVGPVPFRICFRTGNEFFECGGTLLPVVDGGAVVGAMALGDAAVG